MNEELEELRRLTNNCGKIITSFLIKLGVDRGGSNVGGVNESPLKLMFNVVAMNCGTVLTFSLNRIFIHIYSY